MAEPELEPYQNGTAELNGHLVVPIAPPSMVDHPLRSFPGPVAKDKQITVTLFNRAQLISSGLLPALTTLINLSFNSQPGRREGGGILRGHDRLRYDDQLLEELGLAPDTFVYIIRTVDDGELIGTSYAERYEGVEQWPEGPGERTWSRLGVTNAQMEAWELHMMAVHPAYQRQGLANYLMDIVDEEIARRASESGSGKSLVLYISTIKQSNEAFYVARGFKEKYAVEWPAGHLGSESGFTVTHMDRAIKGRSMGGEVSAEVVSAVCCRVES